MIAMTHALWLWAATATSAATDAERSRRLDDNRACMACHPDQSLQWLASPHAGAFVDGPFLSALAREPRAFCRGCHAPEQAPEVTSATAAAGIGVACVSCHVMPDVDPTAVTVAGVARHPDLTPVDCDGCHEFAFPDGSVRVEPLLMQRTIVEHAGSTMPAAACSSCHARTDADGRHDHRMAVAGDAAMLQRALDVRVERTEQGLRIELRVLAAAHAVPTGDLFRRIEVGAVALDVVEPRAPALRWLSRRFDTRAQTNAIAVITEVADDRVAADGRARVIELRVPAASRRAVAWWVEHQRVAFPRGYEPAAQLDGRIPMAGGVLPSP